ncbi:MAG: hypothetical protein AB1476_01815 [Candidatus Hadarchaeota archaeon]
MKVAILTLGFHPRPLEHIIQIRKPNVCYLVASPDGLKYTASEHGYKKPNSVVLQEAARKARCKLQIVPCDAFDPESIGDALGKVLEKIKPSDEVTINYSGGTQAMSLVLGSVAIILSRIMPIKVLYSTRSPGGKEKILDHTDALKELFHKLYEIVPGGF